MLLFVLNDVFVENCKKIWSMSYKYDILFYKNRSIEVREVFILKTKNVKRILLSIIFCGFFMIFPFSFVSAATPYNVSAELYEWDGVDTADFLANYQDGAATKIASGSALNPGTYMAVGITYKVGVPADAMQMQIGLNYDPALLEVTKDDDFIMTEFDNRAEKNGGVFPGTGSAATRVRWTLGDSNEVAIAGGLNQINITLGDETTAQSVLTNPGGVMFFYFFKVKEDAPSKTAINFTFDDDNNSTSNPDGTSSSMTSTPVSYTVFGAESNDKTLGSLSVTNGSTAYTLSPAFMAGGATTSFATTVPNSIDKVVLAATPKDGKASILPGDLGEKSLSVGDNSYHLTVTAEDGSTEVYTISVKRLSNVATLSSLSLSGVTITPNFNSGTLNYTATVPYQTKSTSVSADATAPGTIKSGTGAWSFPSAGVHTKQIVVQAENCHDDYKNVPGNSCTEQTYEVSVTRQAANTDASLRDIKVNNVSIAGFSSGTLSYTLDPIASNVASLTVSATTTDSNATYKVAGNTNLQTGNNTINIVVTAEDGTTKATYTLGVYKKSNNTKLATLTVTSNPQGVLSPSFSANTKQYTYTYDESVSKITVGATASDSNAQGITGLREYTIGTDTKASLEVTAEDGTKDTYTVNFVRKRSSDNSLSSLSVEKDGSPYVMTPSFSAGGTEYTVTVPNDVANVEIKATANSSNIKGITGTGNVALAYGDNLKKVVVTAEDNTSKTYNIKIVREKNTDATLTDIKVNNTSIAGFASGTTNYTLDAITSSVSTLTVSATTKDSNASYTVSGNTNLQVGNNTITILVTAQDGTTKKTYTLQVYKKSNDTKLSNLTVTSSPQGVLSPSFSAGTKKYTYTYEESVSKITVAATAHDSNAQGITGLKEYTIGTDTQALIEVTAEDGTKDTYTVEFERKSSSVNTLSSLSVEKDGTVYPMTPSFGPDQTSYTVTVPNNVASVEIKATASSNNIKGISGTGVVSLNYGDNQKQVVVTAEDDARKTYHLTIKRELSNDATLTDIKVNNVSIADFASGTYSYTLDAVGSATSSLNISYTKKHTEATVAVSGADKLIEGQENTIAIVVTAQDGHTKQTYTLKVRRKSSNANLTSLAVTSNPQGTLTPVFQTTEQTYTYKYDRSVQTIHVEALASDALSVSGSGDYTVGTDTQALIVVTPEDGNVKNYVVHFEQIVDTDSTLSQLVVEKDGTAYPLTPGFSSSVKSYTLNVDSDVSELDIRAVANNEHAKVISGTGTVTLSYGTNTFSVVVEAEDKSKTTYEITIIRAVRTDSGLTSLAVDGTSVPGFTTSKTVYTLDDVDYSKDSIEITATGQDGTTITGTGTKALSVGDNTFEVVVTAQDGHSKTTYTIHIHRKSDNAYLSKLEVSEGTLTPSFSKEVEGYTVSVSSEIRSIVVKAQKEDANATIRIGKEGSLSKTDTFTLSNLASGDTVVKVEVTSEMNTKKTYTITITRDQDPVTEKITSSVYNVTPDNILGVASEVSISTFKDNLDNDNQSLVIYESDGITEYTGLHVGTGMIVKLIISGEVKDQKTIVVLGDTTGDGVIDLLDAVKVTNHYIGKSALNGPYEIAGNVISEDDIDLLDAVKITNHYIGKQLIKG